MSPSPVISATEVVQVATPHRSTISWGSVIAGMLTAIAIQIGLSELCVAAGLALYSPFGPHAAASSIAMGTMVAWLVCALIGLFIGGWVAGRLAHFHSRTVALLHGVLVWATGAVVAALLVASAIGMVAGGTVSLVGEGVNAAARGAQAIAPAVAQIAAPSWDAIRQQIDAASSKVAASAQAGTLDNRLAEQSRMTDLLGKFFTREPDKRLSGAEKEEFATLLASQVGISREAAVKTIEQWQTSWNATVAKYDAAVAEAKDKAAKAAIAAKDYTASAAGIAFVLMLIGAVAAGIGGLCGSLCCHKQSLYASEGVDVRRTTPSFT